MPDGNVTVNVIEKANGDAQVDVIEEQVQSKENTNVPNTTYTVDPTKVPVKKVEVLVPPQYAEVGYACADLADAQLFRTDVKQLTLVLECGDHYTFDTEKLLAVIYAAADLDIVSKKDLNEFVG